MTDLEERMRLTVKGQVTWAKPELKRRCDSCLHFDFVKGDDSGAGICALVEIVSLKRGAVFRGSEAIACWGYEAAG